MESGVVKAEVEVLMSKDEEILVESNGEIDALKEEKSVLDGSITENLKVRKRGRSVEIHYENKNQGCEESNGLGMKTGESEGEKETYRRHGRMKREKGSENGIKKEEGSENGQEDVDMRDNGCDVGDSEKSKDLVQENGGAASAVEEGKVMEEDKDSLGDVLKEKCVSSSAAVGNKGKELEEESIRGEKEEGNESEKERSKVGTEGQRSRVRQSRIMAVEKMRLNIELNITDDEDEWVSKRGKKGIRKKKNNNGTSLKENEVGSEIAQLEGKKTEERRRSLRNKGKREGEGKEPNETVTKTRVGKKRDENVGRTRGVLKLISLQL